MMSYGELLATSYAKILASRVKAQLRRDLSKLEIRFGKRTELVALTDDPAACARAIIAALERLMNYEPEECET